MTKLAPEITNNALPLLEPDVLKSFVAVAQTGSMTQASTQVYRTPAAVSMQIKRLEERLGHTLLIREHRYVRLTPEGEVLLDYARRLLNLNKEAVSKFITPKLQGTIRIGTPDDVGTRILPSVFSDFARTHPNVQVDVTVCRSSDLRKRLNSGDLDLSLITGHSAFPPSGEGQVIHTEALVWAGKEGGTAHKRRPLPLALAEHGCPWREKALKVLEKRHIDYRIAYTSENCVGHQAAVQTDLAVSVLPASLVTKPCIRLKDSSLPSLGSYQISLLVGNRNPDAVNALAGYIKKALDIL